MEAIVVTMQTAAGGSSSPLLCFSVGFGFFFVLSLSLHPQNSSVRSSLSHQKSPPVLIFLSAQKSPSESVVCMSPSPKFCHPLCPVIFPYIYRMLRERVTIPVQLQGMGLCLSHVFSIMVVGYGCVGMGYTGFLGKWGGEREREENISKIFFSLVSAFAGEKKQHSVVQNGTVQFFF